MKTRVVILGGNGLFGSILTPHLLNSRYAIFNLVRSKKHYTDILVDVLDSAALERKLDNIQPEFIVNLVALTDVDFCEKHPSEAYIVNSSLVHQISSWMYKNKNCHLIQISTDQLYDGLGPHKENEVRLLNYYSYSKFLGEMFSKQVSSTIVRTNFFGKSAIKQKVSFTDWIHDALINQKRIIGFDDVQFSPISMKTLANFIELIIKDPKQDVFNVGSSHGFSKAEFISRCARHMKISDANINTGSIEDMQLLALRPKDMRMDSRKFMDTYKIGQMPKLSDEIKLAMQEYEDGN